MTSTGDLRVSPQGQTIRPASARHRWGLDYGGEVGCLDLGEATVIVPERVRELRRSMFGAVTRDDWDQARQGSGVIDLARE
jgi:hypothetical protein